MKKLIASVLLLASIVSPSFAADSTVSALTAASNPTGPELLYCVQSGADRKCSANQLSAFVDPFPTYKANNFNWPLGMANSLTSGTNAHPANTISCKYGYIPHQITLSALGATVNAAGTTNFQLAIYANSGGFPSTLIGNTGNILDTAAATVTGALAANKQVGPGGADGGRDLWFCANTNDSTVSFWGANVEMSQGIYVGSASATDLNNAGFTMAGISCAGANCTGGSSTFNTWPATLAGSTWTIRNAASNGNINPVVFFKVASVP